jgi:hypothetical protein
VASEQTPSVGRSVHYVGDHNDLRNVHLAAIITSADGALCSLAVFTPTGMQFHLAVRCDPKCGRDTWHWPERV